jgi:hypothetical protein
MVPSDQQAGQPGYLAQAEYLHTQFQNGRKNSQSNFRLGTGVVFGFGKR